MRTRGISTNNSAQQQPVPKTFTLSFEQVTYSTAAAGFIGIAFLQLLAASVAIVRDDLSIAFSNALGGSVCLIAGIHYQWMRLSIYNNSELISTRYSDWYITTFLMLVEFFNISGTIIQNWEWLTASCIACELMLLCGHVATVAYDEKLSYATTAFVLGLGCGVALAIFVIVGTMDTPVENQWMYAFMAAWVLYPVAFCVKPYRNIAYNLLDIYSKGIFGIVLGIITFLQL